MRLFHRHSRPLTTFTIHDAPAPADAIEALDLPPRTTAVTLIATARDRDHLAHLLHARGYDAAEAREQAAAAQARTLTPLGRALRHEGLLDVSVAAVHISRMLVRPGDRIGRLEARGTVIPEVVVRGIDYLQAPAMSLRPLSAAGAAA